MMSTVTSAARSDISLIERPTTSITSRSSEAPVA
jgi:hypothetical protein